MADKVYNKFVLEENGVRTVLLDLSQYPNMVPENFVKKTGENADNKYINHLGVEVEGAYEVKYWDGKVEVTDNE